MGDRAGSPGPNDHENGQPVSERTPLIKTIPPPAASDADGAAVQEEETTVIAEEVSMTRIVLTLGTTYVGVILGAIDSTIVATLSAPIASEFQSLSLLSWLATAYLISNAACQPISGRLTDIFGRGPGLVFSNVVFGIGNLICGLARDEVTMIVGRVIAGIGGGGLMAISTFLASDLIPLRQRGIVQGIGNICYGSGAMLGGIFGGLLNDHTRLGWRLAFLVQVPPVFLSAVAVAFLVRVPPKQSDKSYLARIDYGGVLLTIASLVLLLLGLNSGGNIVPWLSPLPLTTIPLSFVTFAAMVWWELRATQPILPVRLLFTRTPLAACLCNLFCTMAMLCSVFYAPLYLQVIGHSSTKAGLMILPSPVGVAVGSIGTGIYMRKTGRYLGIGIACLLVFVAGIGCFSFLGQDGPQWLIALAFALVGIGYGGHLTTTLLGCIASVDHSQQAVVTSATYLARSLGGTIGITIGSAVYQNILKSSLWEEFGDKPHAAEWIKRIRDDLDTLKHLPEGWHEGVMRSFMAAFSGVWLTLLSMAVLGLVCISMLKQHTLHSSLDRRPSTSE
ncbi:hypothetical protein NLU13_9419 [Sarocladium strictum]|uniref:Major facilitator superfamily (MFS) profile domain-containing protein n=1 Tax=Sarocladium strictum TaxID=5046 RepID=A0AA39L462_SARSR|nr:hypothetical protein NLU13_9419 [Sarocladium strictum]